MLFSLSSKTFLYTCLYVHVLDLFFTLFANQFVKKTMRKCEDFLFCTKYLETVNALKFIVCLEYVIASLSFFLTVNKTI